MELYAAFAETGPDGDHYITTSLGFLHETRWARATNRPIDMVAVDEAIAAAPSAGMVLEFGVFEATTIRDLSLYMEQRHGELARELGRAGHLGAAKDPPGFLTGEIHGFDSFEGLPTDWSGRSGMKAGHFSLRGQMPPVFIECAPPACGASITLLSGYCSSFNGTWNITVRSTRMLLTLMSNVVGS